MDFFGPRVGGSKHGVSQRVMLQQSSISSLTPSSSPPQVVLVGAGGAVVDMNLFLIILGRCFNLKITTARATTRRRRAREVAARTRTRTWRWATLTLSKRASS